MSLINLDAIAWDKVQGLIPAIIQDATTGNVLMLGYMNQQALAQTLESNLITFFSRSRNALWVKGETSGNYLKLVDIALDCDHDSLLITAHPQGPTCHEGTVSCFKSQSIAPWQILATLETTIAQRQQQRPTNSYTTTLFEAGLPRVAQKVGEEAVETVIAALSGDDNNLRQEISDMLYHLLVLMRLRAINLSQVYEVLVQRHHTN